MSKKKSKAKPKAKPKADPKSKLIASIKDQEQEIIDLTPNARKHGKHPHDELKALTLKDLKELHDKNEDTIMKII